MRQLPEALVTEGKEIGGFQISFKNSVIHTDSGPKIIRDEGKRARDINKRSDELNQEIANLKSKIENMG